MNDDAQILIARLLTHQTLRREDKLVKRVLSDELFRAEVDARLLATGLKLLDNVYADHVTLALTRAIEPKIFGARDVWQNNNFGLSRDGVALLVVLWAQIILPKRERQETHQHAEDDQNDMFGVEKPLPRAEDTSIGIAYKALLADFGDKLGKKTRLDMNLGILSKLGFIERRGDIIVEGPLLDLMMDTDMLKERIINGALSDVFKRAPAQIIPVPRRAPPADDADPVRAIGNELAGDIAAEPDGDIASDTAVDISADIAADIGSDISADIEATEPAIDAPSDDTPTRD
jgi:hypothetical protein